MSSWPAASASRAASQAVWRDAELFARLREPQSGGACRSCGFYDSCRGGCMAAKFFTGLPLDGPDPECAAGHGAEALRAADRAAVPRPAPTTPGVAAREGGRGRGAGDDRPPAVRREPAGRFPGRGAITED